LSNLTVEAGRSSAYFSESRKKGASKFVLGLALLVYALMTCVPFYFLTVRTLIPTSKSSQFHWYPPHVDDFDMEATYGGIAVNFNLNLNKFKEAIGITGYISPHTTFNEIADKHLISKEKIMNYMNPYMRFNGWLVVLKDDRFIRSVISTVLLVSSSIVVGGFFGIMTGFGLAGLRRKWKTSIYNLYLMQVIIPPMMIMVPTFIIISNYLNLYDSYFSLFLLNIKGGALSTMVFTSYISTIPVDLKESVEIDGGSKLSYFIHIVLPLMKVPFASFTAISLPLFWNNLLDGLLYLKPEKYTLTPLISNLQGTFSTNFQAVFSGLALSLIPILLIYLLFQDLFVKSALSGAVKG